MSTEVATIERPRRDIVVQDAVPVMDSAKFEMMQRVANIMASGSLVPETLTHVKVKGQNDPVPLPYERILANCFLVVNQAIRWGLDPFAVGQCVSVVHGKLCYEGKLISAVLESKLGVQLSYEWNDKPGDAFGIKVSGTLPDGRVETVEGTVGDWKTTGNNSPWGKVSNHRKMLAYRGAREWARLFAPSALLGVYSDDELADLAEDARARRATPVASNLSSRLSAPAASTSGFDPKGIERELAPVTDVIDSETGEITVPASETGGQTSDGTEPSPNQDSGTAPPLPPESGAGGSSGDSVAEQESAPGSAMGPALDAEMLNAYSMALMRASQGPRSLKAMDGQFWSKHEFPPGGTPNGDAVNAIYAAHSKRVTNAITMDACKAQVAAIVKG